MSPKLLGIILLVVGVILLIFGFNASQSLGDQVTETVTGRFTDETMWYIIGGAVAIVVGGFMTLGRK
ncbi:DUF3185 family protein [Methylophaga sp.]|jgi:uncharacterized membrane protein|uniref:DUF3185 family protein n=1 Tax=Methylophaga sp. TaxID=2024840 RepID=UPI003A8F503A